ncbi:MAG: hypothetical protein ACXVCE_14175 [Bacteriovorax sp.]
MNFFKKSSFIFMGLAGLLLASGCISDPGVLKKRGLVKDFSVTDTSVGCGTGYLVLSQSDTCASACGTGTHLANATELATAKANASTTLLAKIDGSAGVCVDDVVNASRPTNQIDIKSDFCSCINGKSDLISDCASYCASVPTSPSPILYLNTIMGTDIALNTKLGNLYNWCNVQLDGDPTAPQCFLTATDGTNTISNIPVTISLGSNSLTANIQQLALDKTYIVKIVEGKTGSNAQSKEFQLRRKTQTTQDSSQLGALQITPINQYTCMTYGGTQTSTGAILRTSYARVFYYFASNETPPPIPPAGGTNQSQVVCHDEQLHPGNDSVEYPRLEMIPQLFTMWNKTDPRFVNENNTGLIINKTLTTRLYNEYGVTATIDIFKLINYPNRPTTTSTSTANIALGYMMVPFTDKSGKTFCPTQTDFNGTDPLFNLLKEYMDSTEGLYLAEKEAETILDNGIYKTIYGTMFVTETIVKKYGFYIENGLKIKADQSSMNTKTIYYYWPTNDTMDPLAQGNRKLYTVRSPDSLNGNVPTGQSTTAKSTDKRIGCVPKSN